MNGGELFLQPKRPVEPMDSFLGVCRGTRHQITSSCQPSVERSGDPAEHFGIPEGCILAPRECFGHVLTMHAMDDKLSLVCAVLVPVHFSWFNLGASRHTNAKLFAFSSFFLS